MTQSPPEPDAVPLTEPASAPAIPAPAIPVTERPTAAPRDGTPTASTAPAEETAAEPAPGRVLADRAAATAEATTLLGLGNLQDQSGDQPGGWAWSVTAEDPVSPPASGLWTDVVAPQEAEDDSAIPDADTAASFFDDMTDE